MQTSREVRSDPGINTLRGRLLLRSLLLIVFIILIFAALLYSPQQEFINIVLAALFIACISMIFSIFSLVQNNLLNPLSFIKDWARKQAEGRFAEPIPLPSYKPFAELAIDLNLLATKKGITTKDTVKSVAHGSSLTDDPDRALYELLSTINISNGLDDLLTRFLFTLKKMTAAEGAAIWISSGGNLELAASSGIDEKLINPGRIEVKRCLTERSVTEGKIWTETSLAKCEKIAGQRFFERNDIGLLSIPVHYRSSIKGVINLFVSSDILSGVDELKPLLGKCAHHLGIAIEKARSEEITQQHMINDERTRIAHELHDSLAQSLASIRFQVRVLDETLHQGDESTTWQQLEQLENSLDEANTELRELISNFRAPLFKRGLIESIEKIVSQFRNETKIKTFLQKEWSKIKLSKDAQVQILRIIREALWNIRKHSEAKTVRVMLYHDHKGKHNILIEDDGVGFTRQTSSSDGDHVGLSIMKERANRFGGQLRIESEPGEGTRIILSFNESDMKLEIKSENT